MPIRTAQHLRTLSSRLPENPPEVHWAWASRKKPDTPTTAQIEQDLIDALRARAADGLPR